jgi:hypothetical protein
MRPLLTLTIILFTCNFLTAQEIGKTTIEFESQILDYGVIKKGVDGTREFRFKNIGENDFVLAQIFSSCTCDIISKPQMPIQPGEVGKIVVTYNTNKVGPIVKTITIKGNMERDIIPLKLKGKVVE